MAEPEKARIDPLREGQDFATWKIRIEAICHSKGLIAALEHEQKPDSAKESDEIFHSNQKKACGIIVSALSNEALRVVRSDIGNPCVMLRKLGERYDSKTAASRIAKMTELISLRYTSSKQDMGKHIDKMRGILEKLDAMNTNIPHELSIAILIASVDAIELVPTTAALKTLSDENATWDTVSARLIEEQQSLKSKYRRLEKVQTAKPYCHLFSKKGHTTERCWLNPRNPNNKLDSVNEKP